MTVNPYVTDLVITEHTKNTCQLINLIATNKGCDVSSEIETCITNGAYIYVRIPFYMNGINCDSDTYDDFIYRSNELTRGYDIRYYPITYGIRHHCHPNILSILHKYSRVHPESKRIYAELYSSIKEKFSQLYTHPYYIGRSTIPGTFHHGLKQLVGIYLTILGISESIFDA